MLDKKTDAVLRLLLKNVGENYKVLSKTQLLAELPQKLRLDEQKLQAILTFLKEDEYIDVKYQDKNEICLAATVKAVSYDESVKNVIQKASISSLHLTLLFVGVFLSAFLGALVAVLLGKIL